MNKRKLIPLALLLLAVPLLAAALLLLCAAPADEASGLPLCPLTAGEVDRVRYTTASATVDLSKNDDGTWHMTDDPALPLEQNTVSTMVESICALQADRTMETLPPDAEIGLDAPTVSLELSAGAQSFALTVGAQNAVTDESYTRVDGVVYMVSAATLSGLFHAPAALYAPQTVSATSTADLAGFSVQNGGGPLDFTWDADAESWRLTDDTAYALDQTAVARMANTICNMQSVWSVTAPQEDAVYGLDIPNVTVTARRTDGGRVTLRFGLVEPDPDGEGAGLCYVACDAAPGVVYEVEAEHLNAFAGTKATLAAPAEEGE